MTLTRTGTGTECMRRIGLAAAILIGAAGPALADDAKADETKADEAKADETRAGEAKAGKTNDVGAEIVDATAGDPETSYAPSPAYPHGRMNPEAPAELAQFAFMIGEFDCIDTMRQADGSKLRFRAIWNARFFLNGLGIQDEYWTPRFFTSNIRIFDPDAGKWKVTFFRMPGYQSGIWEGVKEGERMVMRQGKTSGPGLTFHNITREGFDWNSGGDDPGWTSTCKRRLHTR